MTIGSDTGDTSHWTLRRHRHGRWWLGLLILTVAGAVALWPRTDDAGGQAELPPGIAPGGPQRPAADVVAARVQAQLRPCPPAGASNAGPVSLRGVRASCLGDGTTIDLGAALAGRTTLINVWASWCQPCREELPVLDAYATSPGAAQVLGVQVHSDPDDGLGLLAALGVHLPSVVDTDGTVTRALRTPAYLPVSYVVTSDGTVRRVLPPTPFSSPGQVDRTVRRLASAPSRPAGSGHPAGGGLVASS